MKYTGNYNLKKPDGTDVVNIEDFNENADIIDAELKKLNDAIKDLDADGITLPDGKTISEKFTEITTKIGNTEELDTETKLSLVAAINEINQALVAHKAENATEHNNLKNDIIEIKNQLQFSPVKSWADVQHIVRQGLADKLFKVGDQFVSSYDGGEIIWEVIGIDVDTPADSNFTHSMTIQTKDCLHDIQFDAKEPNNPDSNRKSYGNNRYIHSAVRQWLNSSDSVFNWQSQHQYDAKPTSSLDLYEGSGFLSRLDPELAAVIGEVNKKVARNTVVDGGGQDNFTDKVFLLSRKEVGLGEEGDITGEFVYPFYDGIADAGRIKQLNGSNRNWWLRSPIVSYSCSVRYVSTGGSLLISGAHGAHGVSPACVII